MNKINVISLLFLVMLGSKSITATQVIHYTNKAVLIALHQGEERTLHFGDHVEVGITKGMQEKQLFRIQSAQGSLHILSYETFDKQRVQVRRLGDNQVLLFDLIATTSPDASMPLEDIKIIMPYENKVPGESAAGGAVEGLGNTVVTPVDLTRFVAQKLYGPSRLSKEYEGISPSAIGVKGLIKLFKGENQMKTASQVVLAYEGGGYFISALHIKNLSESALRLNYLDLNIPYSHATFQHHSLGAKGQRGDSTVLYLVSERSMTETLYPWTYYSEITALTAPELVEQRRGDEQ